VRIRVSHPFSTTAELAQAIEGVLRGVDRDIRQPAFFKPLRIAVNDELGDDRAPRFLS